jgi:hypothetical protein
MCLRRAPEKYIAGAALDRAGVDNRLTDVGEVVSLTRRAPQPTFTPRKIPGKGCVDPRVILRLEGSGQLKYLLTSSEI